VTTTVVVVTYRSADVLSACLASISCHAEVIVVSQDATDDVQKLIRCERPSARVIASGRNRGFGAGCNLGAANATGDVLVFLNPDARLTEGSLGRLVAATLANNETLTGPRIIDEDGKDITRARNWSTPWTDVVDLLVPLNLRPIKWRRDIPPESDLYRNGGSVAYIQGACMAIGRRRFAEIGGFDEELFLFGEEEFLAQRLACAGHPTRLEPQASIVHTEHTSLAKTRGFAVEQYFRTRAILNRRDTGARDIGLFHGTVRCLPLASALLFLLLTSPLRLKLRYRRTENAAWCRAALRGLFRGLLRRPVTGADPAR
jgi:N-acetylglucosaminyl-diphospho-decaprenol L-rhamnosyltransferase